MAGDYARMVTVFTGEPSSLVNAFNEINGAATNTGRRLDELGRGGANSISLLDKEWSRFKRHFGYATAGLATYELFNAISRLKDYQTQLAQVNSTLGESQSDLQQFGNIAIQVSNKTAQPLDDVLQSIQNIAQSLPGLSDAARRHLIPAMAEIEAMGSQVAGTDPRSFGSIVLGITRSFFGQRGATPQRLSEVASKIITTGKTTPNVTGDQLIAALPMLAGGANVAGFTLDQMLALFTTAQRTILRPTTTSQYLRQLMIRLHSPTRAEAPFFAQAGLTPDKLAAMNQAGGGMQILQTLLLHALGLPGNNLNGMTPAQFLANPSFNRTTLGPAANEFIQQTIGGRIQSLVAARAISQSLGQVPLQIRTLNTAPNLEQRFQDMDLGMQRASTSLGNMTTAIGSTFLPAIDVGAGALYHMSNLVNRLSGALNTEQNFVAQHTQGIPLIGGRRLGGAAEIATLVAGGIGIRALGRRGLSGLGRLLGRRGATTLGGIAGAGLEAERGIIETEAASNALAGQARGTPAAPFWVVIHPLSMSQIPLLNAKNFPGLGNQAEKDVPSVLKRLLGSRGAAGAEGAAGLSIGRRIAARFGRRALAGRVAAGAITTGMEEGVGTIVLGAATGGLGIGAYDFFSSANNKLHYAPAAGGMTAIHVGEFSRNVQSGSLLAHFMTTLGHHGIPKGLQSYFFRFAQGKMSQQALEQAIANYSTNTARAVAQAGGQGTPLQQAITGMFRLGPGHQLHISNVNKRDAANGYVEATLTLEPTQEFKNLLQPQQIKVHIPISDLPASTSRARTRVARK